MADRFHKDRAVSAAAAATVSVPVERKRECTSADQPGKVLLAILATPPETSGERTLKRLELARRILGFDSVKVFNLLDVPTSKTSGMSSAGKEELPWLQSRAAISAGLAECDGVVLGYGVSEPTGTARLHYRTQIQWLWAQLRAFGSSVWSVQILPRHPSRWHRLTCKLAPDTVFAEALQSELLRIDSSRLAGTRSAQACLNSDTACPGHPAEALLSGGSHSGHCLARLDVISGYPLMKGQVAS